MRRRASTASLTGGMAVGGGNPTTLAEHLERVFSGEPPAQRSYDLSGPGAVPEKPPSPPHATLTTTASRRPAAAPGP